MPIQREFLCRVLYDHLPINALVVAGLGTTGRSWRDLKAPQLTYYASDPMGMGVPMALGLALARPDRTIFYLGGDGDLVMSLGSLLTVVGANTRNLKIAIFDNGRYETGGSQPLAASGKSSLVSLARGAGFPWAGEIVEATQAPGESAAFFREPGPAFLALKVAVEPSPYGPPPIWSQAEDRAIFMRRLAGEL